MDKIFFIIDLSEISERVTTMERLWRPWLFVEITQNFLVLTSVFINTRWWFYNIAFTKFCLFFFKKKSLLNCINKYRLQTGETTFKYNRRPNYTGGYSNNV